MMEMNKFDIEIRIPDSIMTINMSMSPGEHVMDVAEKLSIAYPDHHIDVTMFARIRRIYLNGKVTISNPNLSKFYALESDRDRDQWDWTCYGRVKN